MKKINILKKIFIACLTVCMMVTAFGEEVNASSIPYDTYNYDYREYIHFTPAAYVPDRCIL